MERLRMTCAEFKALPEYSGTFPTGTTIGKRWRRLDGVHDMRAKAMGHKPRWMIGEYVEGHADPDMVLIKWWKPVIIVSADTSPVIPYRDLDILHRIAEAG
jgi:hypothetical protein